MKNTDTNEKSKVGPGSYEPKVDYVKPKTKGFVIKKEEHKQALNVQESSVELIPFGDLKD